MKSCFAPVIDKNARVLVLGSLPGEVSLDAQQYYAHPRNAFWMIMSSLFGFDASLPYEERLVLLQQQGVALWDVVAAAERQGSLDTAIKGASVQANDFAGLLTDYPRLNAIFLNGRSVQTLFDRHVRKKQCLPDQLAVHVMPSTSPANARMRPDEKLKHWALLKHFVS